MKYFFSILFFAAFVTTHAQGYVPERNNKKMIVQPAVALQAYSFNLADVELLDGSPFKNAMQKDAAYLLLLDPDRLLHRFYENAGLTPKAAVYGGWESEGLSGHTMGHYLSACAMMYASLKDERFKKRVDYIVAELARCQQARKTGYVGAIPKEDSIFGKLAKGEIHTSGFDLNGGWSPFYTVHKLMAGLADAYLYCDNKQALTVVTGMADWVGNTLKELSPAQIQQMLKCEYGGMNDVLANIYAITGNKKYLALANVFFDDFVMQPLSRKIDPMPGKHSNTNVPKAIGCARLYELTGSDTDKTVASYFWQLMVRDHSYVIGGNSNYEYCGTAGKLNDQLSDATCETCNTYNMLKLTKHLLCWQPTAELGDYYERALYNHILASQNPDDGMMCYFVPLRMGTKKQFSDSFNTFTCCVGSGMENHSKYAESIYFEGNDGSLYVNLFTASKLDWKEKNITVTQTTTFPESDNTTIKFNTSSAKKFAVFVRLPHWAKQGAIININGKKAEATANANDFLVLNREWKNNDEVSIEFPKSLYTESMPDNNKRIAVLYGPLVLAGQLGDTMPDPVYGIPVLLTDNANVNDWVKPVNGQPNTFTTINVAKPVNTTLIPFYKSYKQYYTVYWDYFTNDEWVGKQAAYEAEKKRQKAIDERTVDILRPGEMQPERDHNLQASNNSFTDQAIGRSSREARSGGYFSFDMKVQPDALNVLLCTYIGDDKNRLFDISIDGTKIATVELNGAETGVFYDNEYTIPEALTKGKSKVTVRVDANAGKTAGRIFGCRILKTK